MQAELIIRDWLADNLHFIEEGLKFIRKEFYLPDKKGSNGFVDILCTDRSNNFVIIEIKRSNPSARQTFTEVFKYAELIRNNYKARESEIRIIIISTHWDEIYRAYSFAAFNSTFPIQGYLITIDETTQVPQTIQEVIPVITNTLPRRFMLQQALFFFQTIEKRQLFHHVLKQRLTHGTIADYVITELDAPRENLRIIYPYAIVVAFQEQTIPELLHIIRLLDSDAYPDMDNEDFDDDDLEGTFIASLNLNAYCDDIEACFAATFDSMINEQNWKIITSDCYGIFYKDPRYSADLLLKELRGYDGNSQYKFTAFSESSQPERLKEIRQQCQHALSSTPHWSEFIDYLLEDLMSCKEKFRLLIDIYNPPSLLKALYAAIVNNTIEYLPFFSISVDYVDSPKTEIYTGELHSSGLKPYAKIFTPIPPNETLLEIEGLTSYSDNELSGWRMGLSYTVSKIMILNGQESSRQFVLLDDDEIIPINEQHYPTIQNYIATNRHLIAIMIDNYNKVYYNMT